VARSSGVSGQLAARELPGTVWQHERKRAAAGGGYPSVSFGPLRISAALYQTVPRRPISMP
jgi:hypothetical protein